MKSIMEQGKRIFHAEFTGAGEIFASAAQGSSSFGALSSHFLHFNLIPSMDQRPASVTTHGRLVQGGHGGRAESGRIRVLRPNGFPRPGGNR